MSALGLLAIIISLLFVGLLTIFSLNMSIQNLVRMFFFLAIFSGFLRRISTWIGISFLGNLSLYILPFLCVIICFKVLISRKLNTVHKKSNYVWQITIFVIILGSFFPINQNIFGSIITLAAFLPLVTFFIIGRNSLDLVNIENLRFDLMAFSSINALYCIYQYLIGFPIWDRIWVENQIATGFTSLAIHGASRPFGLLTSPAESASFLAIGFFLFIGGKNKHIREYQSQILAFVCLFALVTTGVRTSMILFVLVIILTFSKILNIKKFLPSIAGFFLLIVTVNKVVAGKGGLSRILDAFTNPTKLQTVSDRTQNSQRVFSGLFDHPIGFGLSGLVNGAIKYGNIIFRATDVIFADAAISLGFIGLIISVYLVSISFLNVIRLRKVIPIWILVIPLIHVNYLLNPNHYAITPLAWLALGFASQFRKSKVISNLQNLKNS